MARPLPSDPQGPEDSSHLVPESPNPTSTADGERKKKKKSRKSKHKDLSSPAAPENGVESSAHQDEGSPRPSKRKHESEHEHKKKKKKKKHHVAENDVNDASVTVAENQQDPPATSQSVGPTSEKPPKPVRNDVDKTPVTAPSSQAESLGNETTGELNSKGKPKKQRGSRPGGKDNLKVGFFVPDEVQKLEKFKLDFCTTHRLPGHRFDEMVQHSEREGGEFPCSSSITSKSEFWADIYGVLPDRDRRSVYRFMRRHFQATTQKPHEWTVEQDEELVSLLAEHGPKWAYIAKILGRSDDDVTQRWKNKLEHRGTMNRGPWSEEELRAFMEAMQLVWEGYKQILHEGAGKDVYEMDEKLVGWGGISNTMKNVRSRQQCADKWRKIRRAVIAKRAAGFPDAVFDYTKAAKQHTRWSERSTHTKSKEFVMEDDDDEGNVGDDSLPTSAATTPAPKYGFADQQKMMAMAAQTAKETSAESPSSLIHDNETNSNAESEPEGNDRSEEPVTPAAANGATPPAIPTTPLSASSAQKRDAGRMARIKEKIKEANKPSSPKGRRRAEAEEPDAPEPEPEAEPENLGEPSPTDKQSERERKKEKKRKRKERKEQAERERIEAEAAEAVAQQGAEREKKAKKHKKRKDSTDVAEVAEDIAAATPDKKKKKKKHRKSDSGANGAVAEELGSPESLPKKDKEVNNRATQRGSSGGEQRVHESPAPMVDEHQAESELDDYGDDDGENIKLEESGSD